jgi:chromosome segregation protein
LRFTRLRLNGFKSFVDPTELVIHQGLTGVVGPNGCGKSNLLEALRWVMGENRASAMRGDGMDDVIFNGAASRPARHFAEVVLTLDNALRTAPPGFNDHDVIDVARRITRDAGSAYKSNGKDVRARDVQMLFADASTGAHSPALVRQGQISELINARPKSRRRVLEEAAGISGLYQRRHEAELKLQATEANLTRVDDVLEALAQQLSVLTRQARQAERYVELSTALRRVEGQLLYRLWREAGEAATASQAQLAEALVLASRAASGARDAAAAREAAEAELPALREAEVVASAILQRIAVQKEALADEETRATANITALAAREMQLLADIAREEDLNRDAGETIGKLEWELSQLASAEDGHEARLAEATRRAEDAARVLMDAEGALDRLTEDTARLSARHVAAQRLAEENRLARDRAATGAQEAEASAQAAQEALDTAMSAERAAETDFAAATDRLARTEAAVAEAETARADTAAREALARGARSAAEGETQALRAEMQALARLVEREAQIGAQVLDVLEVEPGIETALAAALADDLRAPVVEAAGKTGWRSLAPYDAPPALPEGSAPLSTLVRGATVLDRRLSQIGLVARDAGPALQARLLPGQRLVSREGDLWRWDGFQAGADAAKSTAALRLQQLNRLTALKGELSQAEARATGAGQAHEALRARRASRARRSASVRSPSRARSASCA